MTIVRVTNVGPKRVFTIPSRSFAPSAEKPRPGDLAVIIEVGAFKHDGQELKLHQ
jgi:hypothetical protein